MVEPRWSVPVVIEAEAIIHYRSLVLQGLVRDDYDYRLVA